jgi:hypothetical protein
LRVRALGLEIFLIVLFVTVAVIVVTLALRDGSDGRTR